VPPGSVKFVWAICEIGCNWDAPLFCTAFPDESAALEEFAGLKIIARYTNPTATAMPTKIIKTTATPGNPFCAGTGFEFPSGIFGTGLSPTFVPVMMNFGSSDAGACGAVIFWKHVGHSITEPLCDESHFMCWPHTGQANLNSLMDKATETFHICAPTATPIFN
jgi:hypothetical protein